jgi:hypothetical protein
MLEIFFHINAILVLMNNLRDKSTLEQFGERLKESFPFLSCPEIALQQTIQHDRKKA